MAKDITKIKNAVLKAREENAEYQDIKRRASNDYQHGVYAPKETVNTTTGVADNTATSAPVEPKVSDSAKSLSKYIPTIDKVKSVFSKNKPSLLSIATGGNAKADNLGDLVRTTFDSKNKRKANQEIPTLEDDNALINYYENLPKANVFQRLTSFEKNNAYNQKQALAEQYQQAKDATIPSLLRQHNISTDDLNKQARMANIGDTLSMLGTSGGSAFSDASQYGIEKYLRDKGLNDTDAQYVAEYLRRNLSNKTNENIVDWTGKNFGTKSVSTLGSFPVRNIASVSDTADKLADYIVGNPLTKDATQASRLFNLSQDVREKTMEDMGDTGRILYGMGTSLGDMGTAMLMGNVAGGTSAIPSLLMATQKASDVMNEGIDRELTPDEIVKEGGSSALTTYLTSKLAFNKLDKIAEAGFKSKTFAGKVGELVPKFFASFGSEGAQEAAENVADAFADALIAGDKSKFNQDVKNYEAQGISHDEAEAQALVDYAKEVWRDFWTGGIVGGIVGDVNATIKGWNNNANIDVDENGKPVENANPKTKESVLATQEEVENIANDIFGTGEPTVAPETNATPNVSAEENVNPTVPAEEVIPTPQEQNVISDEELVERFTQARQEILDDINSDNRLTSLDAINKLNELDGMMQQIHPELYDGNNRYMAESAGLNNPTLTADVPPMNIPMPQNTQTQKPKGTGKFRPSQYVTNTILNNPTYRQYDNFINNIESGIAKGDFDVEKQDRLWQNQQAAHNLETDYDGTVRDLISSKGYDGVKTKESMMVLDDLVAEGAGTNDFTKTRKWLEHSLGKYNDAAHALQALAEYTRTASSALMKTEAMAQAKTKKTKSDVQSQANNVAKKLKSTTGNNAKASKESSATVKKLNNRLAKVIDSIGKQDIKSDGTPIPFDEARQQVINTLEQKLPEQLPKMSEQDIDLLTTFVVDKTGGINNKTIQDEIEHYIKHGAFYPLYENVERKSPKNARVARALKNMGYDGSMAVPTVEKSFGQVREEVIGTLSDELASFPEMSDKDIDYFTMLAMDKSVPVEILEDELEHFEKHGTFYLWMPETKVKIPTNSRLDSVLASIGNDGTIKPNKKVKTFDEVKTEAKNSFDKEMGGVYADMSDSDLNFVTTLLMDKTIRKDVIADELEHYAKFGTFYTIDESIAQKKPTNAKLKSILNSAWKDGSVMQPRAQKSFDTVRNEVINTLADEPSSVFADMTDAGYDFLTTLLMDKDISRDTIAKELDYFAKNGKFYNIDESIEVKQASNRRLDNILKQLNDDGSIETPNVQKSFDEIRAEVAQTIANENSNLFKNMDDAKIDFLANMIMRGESTANIKNALLRNYQTGAFEISDEDIKQINEIYEAINKHPNPNSEEVYNLEEKAFDILSKYLGEGSFMEKWNAWRYLAMLGNPRTHLRNVIGNAIFGSVTNVKDAIAATIESAAGIEDRTKAIVSRFNPGDKALMDGGFEDFNTNVYSEAVGDKYSMERGLKQHQKLFKDTNVIGKALNKGTRFNSDLLTLEDTKAMRRKYSRALAGFLKANGKDASVFSSRDEADIKLLEKGRAYALKEAEIATFHEDSKIADVLNQWSKASAESDNPAVQALNVMLESIIPFKKTPINIAKQGVIEYSPVSLGKFVGKLISNATNNAKGIDTKYNPSDIINDFAKGLTGSGIMLLGYFLAKKGFLKGSKVDDSDKLLDEQAYSINIGDKSFTVDWSAPASLPLFVGVELYNAISNQDDFTIMDALGNITQPMVEMSMLQGLRDTVKNVAYADANSTLPVLGASMGLGYASQAVPTLAGQVARTIDPTRRNSYVTGQPSGTLLDTTIRSGEKMLNKIPGLSMLNEPYLDTITGEEQENEDLGLGIFGRALQNMVLPGYYSKTGGESELKQELARLEKIASKDDSIPSVIPDSAKKSVDGEYLSPKEYTKAQTTKGNITTKNLNELLNTDAYKNATDAQKAKLIKAINGYDNQLFYKEMYDKSIDSGTYKKYDDIYKQGGMSGLAEYLNTENAYHEATDALGLEGGSLVKDIFTSEGEAGLQKYKEALNKAATMYGADDITTTEWKDYNNGFMDDFS